MNEPAKPPDGKQSIKHTSTSSPANKWLCINCKAILAQTDERKEEIRIKYKDLYVYVKGGEVTVICRGCGKPNTVKQVPPELVAKK